MEQQQTMDPTITTLTKAFAEAETLRKRLKALEDRINQEISKPLMAQITTWMDTHGLPKLPAPGVGSFNKNYKRTFTCLDEEVLCRHIYNTMTQAIAEGRPLMDCTLWQKTVKQSSVEKLCDDMLQQMYPDTPTKEFTTDQYKAVANMLGVGVFDSVETKFYKS